MEIVPELARSLCRFKVILLRLRTAPELMVKLELSEIPVVMLYVPELKITVLVLEAVRFGMVNAGVVDSVWLVLPFRFIVEMLEMVPELVRFPARFNVLLAIFNVAAAFVVKLPAKVAAPPRL